MQSPELETLDQLLGGDLPLGVVRRLYPDGERFVRGLGGLLATGQVRLVVSDGAVLSAWQWREALALDTLPPSLVARLTPAGELRVG